MPSRLAFLVFLLLAAISRGADVVVDIAEHRIKLDRSAPADQRVRTTTTHTTLRFSLDDLKISAFAGPSGPNLVPLAKYQIEKTDAHGRVHWNDTDLCDNARHLVPARQILYQCHVGDQDLVIVTRTVVSVANAILSLVTHPPQITEVWAVVIGAVGEPREQKLLRTTADPLEGMVLAAPTAAGR